MLGTFVAIVLASLGLVVAVIFGVRATKHLAQVRKTPLLATSKSANAADPANDIPTMRFKGEVFEEKWQGSRGYARSDDQWARASQNWTDYLVVPVFSPLRPSRFQDSSYWTRYLPRVLLTGVVIYIVVPLLIVTLAKPTSGAVGTFSPSPAQRDVPVHSTDYVTDPAPCGTSTSGTSAAGRALWVSYADDGGVFSARPGDLVAINYLYGKPVFSPGVPLCAPSTPILGGRTGVVAYRVADSGTGYIYIPQPNGTVVAEIQVSSDHSALVYLLLGLTAAVFCFDFVVMVKLRRATQARWTRV